MPASKKTLKNRSNKQYFERRKALAKSIGDGNLALFPSAEAKTRNRDVHYPFRQDSDFYYLSGFNEADATLVIAPDRPEGETILFCQARDPAQELWTGPCAGPEGAIEEYGVDQAFPTSELKKILPKLIENSSGLFLEIGRCAQLDKLAIACIENMRLQSRSGAPFPPPIHDPSQYVHEMRLMKSKEEIETMREAAEISASAHIAAMRACRPGLNEAELEAVLLYEFHTQGARWPAYPCIVGGGKNACVLHYTDNQSPLHDGEIVLIDAGCELRNYAADITRSFPVNGRFSAEQREIYQLVLEAQRAALETIRPQTRWNEPHEAAVRCVSQGLMDLGLLPQEDLDSCVEKKHYLPFFMHQTGHWLGMDVHDVGTYKVDGDWRELREDMTFTVEPGIYISPENNAVKECWRGIGIRIEDDILVTRQGCEILSHSVPKEADDIEALMQT